MGLLGFFANACAGRKREIANDPASPHVGTFTRLGYRHLDIAAVVGDPEMTAGFSGLGPQVEAVVDFSWLLREDDASSGAMLRAFERALGSVRFAQEQYLEPRIAEARRFAAHDADALSAIAASA